MNKILKIFGMVVLLSWIAYPILILSGASYKAIYLAISAIYLLDGFIFLFLSFFISKLLVVFQEKQLEQIPAGFIRNLFKFLMEEAGARRSKTEWFLLSILAAIFFMIMSVVLYFLALEKYDYFNFVYKFVK